MTDKKVGQGTSQVNTSSLYLAYEKRMSTWEVLLEQYNIEPTRVVLEPEACPNFWKN